MTEIATIDWFWEWGTSVFSENTAIFYLSIRLLVIFKIYAAHFTTKYWQENTCTCKLHFI